MTLEQGWTDSGTWRADVGLSQSIPYGAGTYPSVSRDASGSERSRVESVAQMRRPYVIILMTWRHPRTYWTLTVPNGASLLISSSQSMYSINMDPKLSCNIVLGHASFQHPNSAQTVNFPYAGHLQIKLLFEKTAFFFTNTWNTIDRCKKFKLITSHVSPRPKTSKKRAAALIANRTRYLTIWVLKYAVGISHHVFKKFYWPL